LTQGSAPNEVAVGVSTWGELREQLLRFLLSWHFLVRMVSGVQPCGIRGAPTGVYMRVSAYSNWISANTGVSH
jgi:secreted trypsin-like serine protease